MTVVSQSHHTSFARSIICCVEQSLSRALQILENLSSDILVSQADMEWLLGDRQVNSTCLTAELHNNESQLISWAEQSFMLEVGAGDRSLVDVANLSNAHRTRMLRAAELEMYRFEMEDLVAQRGAENGQKSNRAQIQAIRDALLQWGVAKDNLLSGGSIVPNLSPMDKSFLVPNSAATLAALSEFNLPTRDPQHFHYSDGAALLERIVVGGPSEFSWASDLDAPRGHAIRKQILVRPARGGAVLRVMQHLGRIDGEHIRTEILPDIRTVDEVLALSSEAREKVLVKGSWVSDITAEKLSRYFSLPGAVFLTLESLQQNIDFNEFAALGSDLSSSARYWLLEQSDRGEKFSVDGNLFLFQQPELLDEWDKVPSSIYEGHRLAWCSSLRVSIDPLIQSEPKQGSKMLDLAMVNLAKSNGFTRLIAKVLDGPPELANRIALRIHKQNGWQVSESTYTENLSITPDKQTEVSWRFVYRDI